MLEKAIEFLTMDDVQELVARGVTEGRHLEFKRELPQRNDEGTREFLADTTAFANAQGGDLIYGVEDSDGVAIGANGIELLNIDTEILRIENLFRDAVEPRLSGVRIKWIAIGDNPNQGILVLRIEASATSPHRVKFKGSSRFFARNSRGKYEMDTHELRQAFTENEALPRRIRALHAEAIRASRGVDMPFRLMEGPRVITSVIPQGFFREIRDLDITGNGTVVPVKATSGYSHYETLEGILMYSHPGKEDAVRAYTLLHRTGRFDASWLVGGEHDGIKSVHPSRFENGLTDMVSSSVIRLRSLGVGGPWAILTTVDGIFDYRMHLSQYEESRSAWRNSGVLPELILDDITTDSLLPVFKAFWFLFAERRPIS
jgi:Putative DNA-binding domain